MSSTRPLFNAIRSGDFQTVHKLAEGIKDINTIRGAFGWTLLHQACAYGKPKIAKYLLHEKKARVNVVDHCGETPLALICRSETGRESTTQVAEVLLANGANMNAKKWYGGRTVLHHACRAGNPQLVQVLLKYGADVDVKDSDGRTPLIDACRFPGSIDSIVLLLANNADRCVKARNGKGPTDKLREYGHEEMLSVLESYDKWPLAVSGVDETNTRQGTAVMLNPRLSQHQHTIGSKALLLVRKLPVHEVAYEILGFLSPADVERIFLPAVSDPPLLRAV